MYHPTHHDQSPSATRRTRLLHQLLRGLTAATLYLATVRLAAAQTPAATPASSGTADTLTLTLREVQQRAVGRNPAFLAARQDTAIARGELRQARVYQFNPDASLQIPGVGLGGDRSPAELTVLQELEIGGQRGLRIGAARLGLTRAGGTVRNAARLTSAEASTAFYRALTAERRLGVIEEVLALNERLLLAVRAQIREGEISVLDANLAEIELGRARGRLLAARRAATSATLELKRLTGIEPDVPVRLAGPAAPVLALASDPPAPAAAQGALLPAPVNVEGVGDPDAAALSRDSLVRVALARRGDVAADSVAIREFEALRALARRQNVPNLRVGAFIERPQGGSATSIGPAVGLSLPLFNRNQGLSAQRAAQAEQARLALQATRLRVRTEVTDAVRAYQTATEESRVFATSVLQPARQNMGLLETAYRAGKIALPSLLLLRNQLLDAELGFWDAWLARREALVQLEAATGTIGDGEAP